VPDGTDAVDRRDQIIRLLSALPPRQRTAVVLRYWEDLSEAEAARAMGCSVGTVKAACSRGLRRLRELSDAAGDATQGNDDDSGDRPGRAPGERDVAPEPTGRMA
jgi:DNA-directed RNA polymerase specialized sigma24 family protein